MRWRFLETIEPARVVHIRCVDLISKDNIYAQVTCRLHTKQVKQNTTPPILYVINHYNLTIFTEPIFQTLAIYDRFGRLMFGNELTPKDVLEYVVFEKHLSNIYGSWRVHGKIIPPWTGAGMDLDMRRTLAVAQEAEA